MALAPLSTGPQSFTPLPTITLGPSGAGSRVTLIIFKIIFFWSFEVFCHLGHFFFLARLLLKGAEP